MRTSVLSVKAPFLDSYLRGVVLDLNGAVYVADDELHSVVCKCFFYIKPQKYFNTETQGRLQTPHLIFFVCVCLSKHLGSSFEVLRETLVRPVITKFLLKHAVIGMVAVTQMEIKFYFPLFCRETLTSLKDPLNCLKASRYRSTASVEGQACDFTVLFKVQFVVYFRGGFWVKV